MAKVSAIITTFNRDEETLLRAYNSIVAQTYDDIEIIIVDDNGKNSRVQKLNEKLFINRNVIYYPLEKNSGAQVARNKGLELASGNYIGFLDDDDEWLPSKIAEQMNEFKNNNEELGLVYCWFNKIKIIDNHYEAEIIKLPEYPNDEVKINLLRSNYIGSTSFPLIKKSVFDVVGNFDENLEASQDYDMWIRIIQRFSVKCVHKPLAAYYIHESERITKNNGKKARAEINFLIKHFDAIIKDNKAMGTKLTKVGIYLMRSGKKKSARKYFSYALSYTPTNIRIAKYYLESLI